MVLMCLMLYLAQCQWDHPISTFHATGASLKVSLHAYNTLLVSANEHDKIRLAFLVTLLT